MAGPLSLKVSRRSLETLVEVDQEKEV